MKLSAAAQCICMHGCMHVLHSMHSSWDAGCHAGCASTDAEPGEGDVRLASLIDSDFGTAPCDDVHLGGVELFRDGRWGRICAGSFGDNAEDFTLDAQVICRQLGFPFGTAMDTSDVVRAYDFVQDYSGDDLTWATEVSRCTCVK